MSPGSTSSDGKIQGLIKEQLDIATSHASGEEAVSNGKAKQEEHTDEGTPDRFGKKKNKRGRGGSFVAAAEH